MWREEDREKIINCKIYSSMIATKYRYDMVAIGELWSSLPGNDLLASDVERWETAVFLGQTDNCCIEGVFF